MTKAGSPCPDSPACLAPSPGSIGALVCLIALFQLAGAGAAQTLQLDREAIVAGEWWRLITGHFVHLGWVHFAINLFGLAILGFAFRRPALGGDSGICKASGRSLASMMVIMLVISGCLMLVNGNLSWYRGLSGVLHGLAILVALDLRQRDRVVALLLLGGTLMKVAWEQWLGATALVERQIGGAVVVDAHLYGVIAGFLYAGGQWFRTSIGSPQPECGAD